MMTEAVKTRKPIAAEKEWLVHVDVKFHGAWCLVRAADAEQAKQRAEDGQWFDGVETNGADLVDWDVTSIEQNE
jgi:hypothetical protein